MTSMRRTDIDGLRILMCASIIAAHALLIFSAEPRYHIKSAEPSFIATALFELIHVTTMAMFFVLAGWSAVTSLRGRGVGSFALERLTRLLVPLVTGLLLFGSIIKYVELSHGRDIGFYGLRMVEPLQVSFFEFFPRNLMRMKLLTWSHLWFLVYLFLMSLALLPLLVRLARIVPSNIVPAAFVVYLPALPMAALLVAFNGYWPFLPNLITDWTNFAYFALCFVIGAGIAAWPGCETRVRAEAGRLLLLMLLASIGLVLSGESAAGRLFIGLTAWGAIGAGLGFAARIKPAPTRTFSYLSEATLPIYIVHHAPLLLLAVAIVPLPMSVGVKIMLIWLGALAISMAAYHWLIRPWPPMRWLMGMSPQVKKIMPSSPKHSPV